MSLDRSCLERGVHKDTVPSWGEGGSPEQKRAASGPGEGGESRKNAILVVVEMFQLVNKHK